jgi:hypothetical protein
MSYSSVKCEDVVATHVQHVQVRLEPYAVGALEREHLARHGLGLLEELRQHVRADLREVHCERSVQKDVEAR